MLTGRLGSIHAYRYYPANAILDFQTLAPWRAAGSTAIGKRRARTQVMSMGAEVDARAKGRRSHRRRECYRIQKESSAIGYWMIIASGRDRCSEVSERTSGVHVPVDVV